MEFYRQKQFSHLIFIVMKRISILLLIIALGCSSVQAQKMKPRLRSHYKPHTTYLRKGMIKCRHREYKEKKWVRTGAAVVLNDSARFVHHHISDGMSRIQMPKWANNHFWLKSCMGMFDENLNPNYKYVVPYKDSLIHSLDALDALYSNMLLCTSLCPVFFKDDSCTVEFQRCVLNLWHKNNRNGSKRPTITQCPSHINDSLQGSAVQVMREMRVDGIILVIDSASNLVVSAGVKDSLEMTDAKVYGWLSMMLNPGNAFKPMLLAAIIDNDSMNHNFLNRKYRCGRIRFEDIEIADHGGFMDTTLKMDVRSAIQMGSNVAWCDLMNAIYHTEDSKIDLANYKLLPKSVPLVKTGTIYRSTQDFFRFSIGYGVCLQPYTLALYYHALVNQGRFRLIKDDCSYQYESICSEQTADEIVDLLRNLTTGSVGVHGSLMDSKNIYPLYIGYTNNLKYTVMVMLDHAFNTNTAMRVYHSIVSLLI